MLRGILEEDGAPRARLLAVVGASVALGDTLVAHPETLRVLLDDAPGTGVPVADVRAELLRAVGADPDADVPVATRRRCRGDGRDAAGVPDAPAAHRGDRPHQRRTR